MLINVKNLVRGAVDPADFNCFFKSHMGINMTSYGNSLSNTGTTLPTGMSTIQIPVILFKSGKVGYQKTKLGDTRQCLNYANDSYPLEVYTNGNGTSYCESQEGVYTPKFIDDTYDTNKYYISRNGIFNGTTMTGDAVKTYSATFDSQTFINLDENLLSGKEITVIVNVGGGIGTLPATAEIHHTIKFPSILGEVYNNVNVKETSSESSGSRWALTGGSVFGHTINKANTSSPFNIAMGTDWNDVIDIMLSSGSPSNSYTNKSFSKILTLVFSNK